MGFFRRTWDALDDRTGLLTTLRDLARHPVPPDAGWWYVFGSATLAAFALQVVTGIALAASYVPSAGEAYDSLQFITHAAVMGRLLRGMHYFGASAMVILIGIHIAQTFLFGAYKFPREMNWLSGAFLLLLTLAMAFTGQLLRWDQTAVWSVIVAAEQAGRLPWIGPAVAHLIFAGDTVGGATLSRFFAIHVFFVPAIIFVFLGLHLWLVVRHGVSEAPKVGQPVDPKTYRKNYEELLHTKGVPFWPDAAWRDVVFSVGIILAIFVLAWWVGPPELTRPPDPAVLNAYPRPDWYFLWYFAVLALSPHKLEGWVIIAAPLVFGTLLLLVPIFFNKGERSPRRRPWAWILVLAICAVIGTFWLEGVRAPWSPAFETRPIPPQALNVTNPEVQRGLLLFHQKGCQYCHQVDGIGGRRGPDLSAVASRLNRMQITIRIINGGVNMPAYARTLQPDELNAIVAFLATRGRPVRSEEPSVTISSGAKASR